MRNLGVAYWNLRFIAALLSFLIPWRATAGYDPSPTEALPALLSVDASSVDVIFFERLGGRYVLKNGDWYQWSAPPLHRKREAETAPARKSLLVPQTVLDQYRDAWTNPAREIACAVGRCWFVTHGICSEGTYTHGRLFSYAIGTGSVTEHEGLFSGCQDVNNAAIIGGQLWLSVDPSEQPGSYPRREFWIYDMKSMRRIDIIRTPVGFTSYAVYGLGYQPKTNVLWVATREGLDRYSLVTRSWEHRFFDVIVTSDNRLSTRLSLQRPPLHRLWMAYHLYSYSIDDTRGFIKSWDAIEGEKAKSDFPVKAPQLLPYYISALFKIDATRNDYEFSFLIKTIGSINGGDEQIRAALDRLEKAPLSPLRRTAVVELRQKFGMPGASQDMDQQFELLRDRYFMQDRRQHVSFRELCNFAFANPKYLETLNGYFVSKPYNDNVDPDFMDMCVRAHSSWPGAEKFLPTIRKALSSDSARMLSPACSIFNHYAMPTFRRAELVLPILQARAGAERTRGIREDDARAQCAKASYWVANSVEGIDTLLNNTGIGPELEPTVQEILREVTGKNFDSLVAWRSWWATKRKDFRPSTKTFYWDPNKKQGASTH